MLLNQQVASMVCTAFTANVASEGISSHPGLMLTASAASNYLGRGPQPTQAVESVKLKREREWC